MRWIGFIFLFFVSKLYGADVLMLNAAADEQPLGRYLDLLEDPHGELTVEDVRSEKYASSWVKNRVESPNLGFTHSVYWVRIFIENAAPTHPEFLLELNYPHADFVDLYIMNQHNIAVKKSCGRGNKFASRDIPYRNCVFLLDSAYHADALYLRINTDGSMELPLILWHPIAFAVAKMHESAGFFLYFGIMIVMVIYNLFLFVSTKIINYLYYVLYITCFMIYSLCYSGMAFELLWPERPWWGRVSIMFFIAIAIFWGFKFFRSFLNTRINAPVMDKLMVLGQIVTFTLAVLTLFIPYYFSLMAICIIAITGLPIAFASGLLCLQRGYRPARFLVLAFFLFLTGGVITALRMFGLLPAIFFTEFAPQIGSAAEVILLSLALADQIKYEQRLAQREIENLNKNLEHKVKEQTTDIMHQKEQLAKANSELTILDRQKTHFFQNISHELRTPLTLILNTQQKIFERLPGDAQLTIAQNNTKRLYRLVNQLLDFQRLQSTGKDLRLSHINLTSFIKICGDYFCTGASTREIQVKTTINGHPIGDDSQNDKIVIRGEIDALEKITFNFLSNALKYSPAGGKIEFGIATPEDRVRIFVKDEGQGIAPEDQAKLFKVFSQVDDSSTREYEGTGLGLALAKELTTKMGGAIGVESLAGQGSCFWAEFPRCSEWKAILDLLIVDDEPTFVELLKFRFQSINKAYHIRTASNVREARALIHQYQIKVLITDQNMPKEDGVSLLNFLLKEQPQCARLMFTGQRDQTFLQRAINQGSVQRVFYKPVDFETILPEILAFIDQSPVRLNDDLKEDFTIKDWLLDKVDSPIKPETTDIVVSDEIKNDKELVLVIDDLRDMRDLVAGILGEQHYRVVTATGGSAGLDKAKAHKPALIIVDWMMPKMSGPEFIRNLRDIDDLANIPVIMLTAKADQESKLQGLRIGADAFLGKPFDELELVSTVANMLRLKSGEHKIATSLEDKNVLVAMITHDIANPLMVVTAATEQLEEMVLTEDALAKNSRAVMCIEQIKKSGEGIYSIISQVKLLESVDNKQTFDFKPVDVAAAFEESLALVKDKIAAKQLVIEKSIDAVAVLCDKSALVHSIITNLLTNAIKFSESRGKITCQARQIDENQVVIEIRDEGQGIPPEIQTVLFSLGHQTSRPGTKGEKGTGFGMPIVKKLLTKMGGTITVESPYRLDNGDICSGAKFSIVLPNPQEGEILVKTAA